MNALARDLADQVGPHVAPFLRWLVEVLDVCTVGELLEVLDRPQRWEEEFEAFLRARRRTNAPSADECEGEERANR